ncbi:hypothetical protein D9613_006516 [Agrocybe pediades]|uniref:F-box domain-containing protein n=1 Tax=Agrocybe pediades TaxID=84607 RepID=A0A8H4QGL1_9AGAR|nr:hypothetical protein D9613_006516 [Agrocybe pediades]
MMAAASALHHDILWNVFHMIATANRCVRGFGMLSETHCLEHLRHASQTCSAWRQTLLSSPSIWAMCLDMDHLQLRTEAWRLEIIRRTANAPIRVTRFRESNSFSKEDEWFFTFLKANWYRLHSLDFTLHPSSLEKFLEIQNLPAPTLIFFKCTFLPLRPGEFERSMYPQIPESVILLGGGAPHLRSLLIYSGSYRSDGTDALEFQMPIQSPLFSQLRSLDIRPVYDERHILHALSSTPLIESLSLSFSSSKITIGGTDVTTPPSILPFPCLKKLKVKVNGNIPASIRFLSLLDMKCCKFALDLCFLTDPDCDLTDISSSLSGILSAYFRHFDGERPTVQGKPLTVYITSSTVNISGGPRDFSLVLQGFNQSSSIPAASFFQAFASSRWYEAAEELRLYTCTCLPELRILLASLLSVKCLQISADEFARIHAWGQLGSCAELLPDLEEVYVVDEDVNEETLGMLHEFLDSRISCGGKFIQACTYSDFPDNCLEVVM